MFAERKVDKMYVVIVRGWTEESGVLDRSLRKKFEEKESVFIRFRILAHGKLPFPVGNYSEVRYSLVEARPVIGFFGNWTCFNQRVTGFRIVVNRKREFIMSKGTESSKSRFFLLKLLS